MILFIVIRFPSLLAQNTNNYEDLHALFFEWRKFDLNYLKKNYLRLILVDGRSLEK